EVRDPTVTSCLKAMVSYIARVASKKDRTSAAPVIGRGNTDASRTTSLVKAAAKASSVGRLMISNQLCPGGRFRSDRRNGVGCGKRSCCAIAKSALAISNKPATILGARQFMSSSFVTFGRDLTRCVGCLSTTPADVDLDHCPSVCSSRRHYATALRQALNKPKFVKGPSL